MLYDYDKETRLDALKARMARQERTTRTSLLWLTIMASLALIGLGLCVRNLWATGAPPSRNPNP